MDQKKGKQVQLGIARYKKEKKNLTLSQYYIKFLSFWLTWHKLIANIVNFYKILLRGRNFILHKNDLFLTYLFINDKKCYLKTIIVIMSGRIQYCVLTWFIKVFLSIEKCFFDQVCTI